LAGEPKNDNKKGSTKQSRYMRNTRPGRKTKLQGRKVKVMTLTSDFKNTVVNRVEQDPAFAKALLDEAATLFLSGEPDTARLILRDLVNATVGFEQLAQLTHKPSKSLHRMLSSAGNSSMDNLAAIFGAIRDWLKVGFDVHVVEIA
jgi:DNA-binding phage protein